MDYAKLEGVRSMMNGGRYSRLRVPGLLVLLALVMGAASCGGSDDADDGGASASSAQAKEVFPDTPEGRIRETYASFVDVAYKKDTQAACDLMTREMQQKLASEMRTDKTCAARLEVQFDGSKLSKKQPKVLSVKLNGSKAVAVTQVKGNARYPIPFTKESGEWKVAGGF